MPIRTRTKSNGFTLLEVMVALLVLAIGLLGMAQLQISALKNNKDSYLRSQASNMAADIFGRMQANKDGAKKNEYNLSMAAQTPAGTTVSQQDMRQWRNDLAFYMPNGKGSINCTDSDTTDSLTCSPSSVFLITIQWTEGHNKDDANELTTFTYSGAL